MEKVLIKTKQSFKFSLKRNFVNSRYLTLMIIPAVVFYAIFSYVPMYGVLLSFTRYSPRLGMLGSIFQNWIGFENFNVIFHYEGFWPAFWNTLMIGSIKVVISFLSAITVALLINEIRMRYFKKIVQIIVTFPHFLSWVIVAALFILLVGPTGSINHMISQSGGHPLDLFKDSKLFLGLIFSSDIWKEAGWSSIIYIATMAGISPDLYEAADIDGASRLQKIWHITLPGVKPTAVLLLIMSVGGVLSAGFDQIFNMTSGLGNGLIVDSVQIIDTLIYSVNIAAPVMTVGQGAAMSLFKSVVGFALVITTDRIAKACGERGII